MSFAIDSQVLGLRDGPRSAGRRSSEFELMLLELTWRSITSTTFYSDHIFASYGNRLPHYNPRILCIRVTKDEDADVKPLLEKKGSGKKVNSFISIHQHGSNKCLVARWASGPSRYSRILLNTSTSGVGWLKSASKANRVNG
jgi:hypothetical protein